MDIILEAYKNQIGSFSIVPMLKKVFLLFVLKKSYAFFACFYEFANLLKISYIFNKI
jgi:hypothetical protein